jgi:hypothetical protein
MFILSLIWVTFALLCGADQRGKFFFTYNVRIDYVGNDSDLKARLTTRHWVPPPPPQRSI